MAAPITHVVLTEKIFNEHFKNRDRKSFFLGTCFPDIRYLGVIRREETHFDNTSFGKLKSESDFNAGLKFHSILDKAREDFIVAHNTYSYCPKSKYITQSLKILEDMIFYGRINSWNEQIEYLNDILSEETKFSVSNYEIKRWHAILQEYFRRQPNENTVEMFFGKIGFGKEVTDEIRRNIFEIQGNKMVLDIIDGLFENFEELIIKEKSFDLDFY